MLVGLLMLAGVLGLIALVVMVPPHLIDTRGLPTEQRLKAENDLRGTLATVLGGIAVLAGTLVAALTLGHNRRVLKDTQVQNSNQLELLRQGQISERFTSAINQLGQQGDDKLDVRLGAIYALEQIARAAPELHGPILNVLCAFLRVHAQSPIADHVPPEDRALLDGLRVKLREDRLRGRQIEIQAVVTVLSHRKHEQDGSCRIDLQGVDLQQCDFRNAPLREAYLVRANLKEASMVSADLRQAVLRSASVAGANLEQALLGGTHLEGVDLSGVKGVTPQQWESALTAGATPPDGMTVTHSEHSGV